MPPFIHASSSSEAMQNCHDVMNIRSRKLFWGTVQMECERILAEALEFDRWELLGSLQALAVYLFVRISEGETEYNNIDTLFINVIIVSDLAVK